MQISPYLSFKGDCEAAFKFYEQCLGGKLGAIFRYAGTSLADQVPADWQDKVMHGSLTVGEQVLMGGDVAPDSYEAPKGFTLSIQIKSAADAERIFHELANGGRLYCRSRKRSGPSVLACSSIASAYRGRSTARDPKVPE